MRALVVDSSPRGTGEVARHLEALGISVAACAADARSGQLRYRETVPDVVLVDLGLVGAGGVAFIRALRAFDPGADIVALATWSTSHLLAEALRAGAGQLVLKPIDADRLAYALRDLGLGAIGPGPER